MNEEQLKDLVSYGSYRRSQGDRVGVLVESQEEPVWAYSLNIAPLGWLDLESEGRQGLTRVAASRVIGLRITKQLF